MRDLRFRAWLKNTKTMEYPEKMWQMFMWAEDESQPIEIMQYTGLKDKHGIDVYEGDVVKLYDSYNDVMSKDGSPIFFNNGYVGGWVIGNKDNFVSLGARESFEVEIIGNIYQPKAEQEDK